MENILFLEGEGVVRETIVKGMIDKHFRVSPFQSPDELLLNTQELKPKWCILDMEIPDYNPYQLAGKIRRKFPKTVIIFWGLTPPGRAVLFELGIYGTGFIKKTLDLDEFIPKFNHYLNVDYNHLWKVGEAPFIFGNSSLSVADQELATPVETFHLTLKETALLEMLLLHRNQVLTREKSLGLIWGRTDYYTARSMDVCIAKLKRKLSGDETISIVNLRSIGHKLLVLEN